MNKCRLCAVLVLSLALFACESTGDPKSQTPEIKPAITIQDTPAQSPLEQIRAEYEQGADHTAVIWSLLNLAQEQQENLACNETQIILWHLQGHILLANQQLEAELLRLECALLQALTTQTSLKGDWKTWLATAKDLNTAQNLDPARIEFIEQALLTLHSPQKADYERIADMGEKASVLFRFKSDLLWNALSAMNRSTRADIAERRPDLASQLALFEVISDEALDDRQRQAQLRSWLGAYASTDMAQNIPRQVLSFLDYELEVTNKIAVLLPLSGELSAQGEAIRQGIMAAYFERNEVLNAMQLDPVILDFIDTGSDSELNASAVDIDYGQYQQIIGPLLNSHIEALAPSLPVSSNQVFLNAIEQTVNAPLMTYFALSPEQEAQQIAESMHEQGIQNPILIFAPSARSLRLKDAFVERWQAISDTVLSEVSYTDNRSMRAGITSALGVLQSEQRIKQLQNLSTETVHSVTRNRRDVDAFVVFANSQEIELINPIIEASISLFDNIKLPVYASSYSYSHRLNRNSPRDLRNIIFFDMPFVNPDNLDEPLALQVDTVFAQPSTSFLRLFAFGYDAFIVANNNLQLNIFEQLSRQGLTGTLSTQNGNVIQRTLSTFEISTNSAGD